MNFSSIPVLATALGILIAWAFFGLFCSYVHEAIAQIKAERGRFLKKYLLKQFNDLPNGINWASLIYLHGTVELLSRSSEKPSNDISPKLFAKTLIETVGSSMLVQSRKGEKLLKIEFDQPYSNEPVTYRDPLLKNFKMATKVLERSDLVDLFSQCLHEAELKAAGEGISNEAKVYEFLNTNLERWYTEFLERVSLWYKKTTRERLFYLGIVLATLFNVDSIQLFMYFDRAPSSTQTVINFYEANSQELAKQGAILDSISKTQKSDPKDISRLLLENENILSKNNGELTKLIQKASLPIGFQENIFHKMPAPITEQGTLFLAWIYRISGILLSGFAASFGGPFWFELLKKIYQPLKK